MMVRIVVVLAVLFAACGSGDAESGLDGEASPAATSPDTTLVTSTSPSVVADTTMAPDTETGRPADECAHVVGGTIDFAGGTATVSATVRSADTGWDKYADRWEVRAPDGRVLGERVLTHPHETEQPFTRSLSDVEISPELTEIVLAAHDSVAGFCGDTFTLAVPDR